MNMSNLSEQQKRDMAEVIELLKALKSEEDMQQASGISLPEHIENQSPISVLGGGTDAREVGTISEDEEDYYDDYDYEDYEEDSDYNSEIVYDSDQTSFELVPTKFIPPRGVSKEEIRRAKREFNRKPVEDLDDESNFKKLMDMLNSSVLPKSKVKSEPLRQDMLYSKDSCHIPGTDSAMSFKRVGAKVDWQFDSVDIATNYNKLCKLVTEELINRFGGLSNIKQIYVYDSQMIVNGVCFMPVVQNADYSSFPLDSADYIMNGCTAPFFKWVYISKMPNLIYLGFDDTTFFNTTVLDGLGVGRRGGVSTIFRVCKNLDTLSIGSECVNRDNLNGEQGKKVKQKVAQNKRFVGLFDGYSLNVYNGTNGVQNWCVNNLVDYAHHRGNKGLIRFGFGLLGRGVVALGATGVNAGTHLAGGILKKVSDVWRSATTPVSDSDAGF